MTLVQMRVARVREALRKGDCTKANYWLRVFDPRGERRPLWNGLQRCYVKTSAQHRRRR